MFNLADVCEVWLSNTTRNVPNRSRAVLFVVELIEPKVSNCIDKGCGDASDADWLLQGAWGAKLG
jgi:hypothetical protein